MSSEDCYTISAKATPASRKAWEAVQRAQAEEERVTALLLSGDNEAIAAEFKAVCEKHEERERVEFERLKAKFGP